MREQITDYRTLKLRRKLLRLWGRGGIAEWNKGDHVMGFIKGTIYDLACKPLVDNALVE